MDSSMGMAGSIIVQPPTQPSPACGGGGSPCLHNQPAPNPLPNPPPQAGEGRVGVCGGRREPGAAWKGGGGRNLGSVGNLGAVVHAGDIAVSRLLIMRSR